MKKILIIILFLILPFTLNSYGLNDKEFVGAKAKLLFAYKTLETNALQITLIYEQRGDNMPRAEQATVLLAKSDLELGMFVTKEILGLYTLQGVQVSTPPEAVKLLKDASLDSSDFLGGLQTRFMAREEEITDNEIRKILKESLSMLQISKEEIAVLQGALADL